MGSKCLHHVELSLVRFAVEQSSASASHPDVSVAGWGQANRLVEGHVSVFCVRTDQVFVAHLFSYRGNAIDTVVRCYPNGAVLVGFDTAYQAFVVGALHQLAVVKCAVVLQLGYEDAFAPCAYPDTALPVFRDVVDVLCRQVFMLTIDEESAATCTSPDVSLAVFMHRVNRRIELSGKSELISPWVKLIQSVVASAQCGTAILVPMNHAYVVVPVALLSGHGVEVVGLQSCWRQDATQSCQLLAQPDATAAVDKDIVQEIAA